MEENKRKRKVPMNSFTRPQLDDAVFTEELRDAFNDQDPEIITRFIVAMIVLANMPLSIVEHFAFKSFLALVVPWYNVPSKSTVLFFV
jgi:hypothetical protein